MNDARFAELDKLIAECKEFSRAEGTRRKYANEFYRFEQWCNAHFLSALPATPTTVQRYCASLIAKAAEPTPSPVLNAVPAIAKFHQVRGYTNPCSSQTVRDFVEGVRRRYGRPPVQKEPLSTSLLQELLVSLLTRSLNRGTLENWELAFGLCLMFRAGSRFSETALLKRKDFDINDERVIVLFQKRKNDQRKQGHKVVIKSSDSPFSFLTILRRYLLRLERSSEFSGNSFILPAIKDGRFVCSKSVSYIEFYKRFKTAIMSVNRDPERYGLHSPKVGAVVALADGGADLRDVEARVGFAPNSGMAERYSRKSLKRNGDLDDILSM